jgi:hypothetical protein
MDGTKWSQMLKGRGKSLNREGTRMGEMKNPLFLISEFQHLVLRKTLWKMADLDRKVHGMYFRRWISPHTTTPNC